MDYANEIKTYQGRLPELVKDAGKHVVIKNETILGLYDTYEDALKAGYAKFGVDSFLVKKIEVSEQVQYFTRELMHA